MQVKAFKVKLANEAEAAAEAAAIQDQAKAQAVAAAKSAADDQGSQGWFVGATAVAAMQIV